MKLTEKLVNIIKLCEKKMLNLSIFKLVKNKSNLDSLEILLQIFYLSSDEVFSKMN